MPYRKEQFINNEIYHVVLRGLDNNLIFKDINDYYRGIFSIYELNNIKPVSIKYRREIRNRFKKSIRGRTSDNSIMMPDERDKSVEILAFCFMPNHIHLLVKQIKDGGVTNFMRKVGTGYGGYFNRKYNREGHVFQNRFHAVHIEDDEQLITVFIYIHANPISLIEPKWKKLGIKDPEKTINFLENHKWSSYSDYIDKKNFPSVSEREFLLKIMGGKQGCKDFIENWVRYKGEISKFANLVLE